MDCWKSKGIAGTLRGTVKNTMESNHERAQLVPALTPEKKLEVAMRLYWSARELKAAGLRMMHPDWPEEKIQEEVRHAFLTARG